MEYVVLSGGPKKTAAESVNALQLQVNEAVKGGAALSGGISVLFGLAPGLFEKYAYEAFQAITYPD